MIDLVQYRFRIGTYTGMGAKGSGRLNSGQFHDSSVFNPYNTSESLLFYTFDTSSGFWMTNIMGGGGCHCPFFPCPFLLFFEFRTGFWDKTDKTDKADKTDTNQE